MVTQTKTHNTFLVGWLNDDYAMEQGIVEALEAQVKLAEDHPTVKDGIQRHLEATKGHAELVKRWLDQLGESPSKGNRGMAMIGAKVQGFTMGAAHDSSSRPRSTTTPPSTWRSRRTER